MKEFLHEFESWYWNREFDDPALRDACAAMSCATSPAEFERAFLVLLRSDDTVARGVALDFFDRAEALTRYGTRSPFDAHRKEVLNAARQMLRQPSRPEDKYALEGANHASALLVLRNDAGPEDTEAVTSVLARRPDDADLRQNALMVAHSLLEESPVPDPRLVAAVGEIVFDRSLEPEERAEALGMLRDARGADATAIFVRAAGEDEWQIQQEAAWALSLHERFYAHRTLLEHLAGSWSADQSSFAASEVHDALSDGPHSLYWGDVEPETAELRTAHRELRAPTGEEAHRKAFRTMLHSGQTVATGIALDHFHQTGGLTRFGLDARKYAPEVLAVAREVLAQPLSPAELSSEAGVGANHASALHVLENLAGPEDAETIANALRTPRLPTAVRERAVQAAGRCLERWDTSDTRLIATLEELIFDDSVDVSERAEAVIALFDRPSPQATAVLVRATRSPHLPIQVEAAVGLTYDHLIDEYRELLTTLVESWPEDAGDRAFIVHSELSQ